jgi:hypothetical protein
MVFVHRSADYRHQVLDLASGADARRHGGSVRACVAMDLHRANLAEWDFWFEPDDLAGLGLIPDAPHPGAQAGGPAGRAGELQQSSR